MIACPLGFLQVDKCHHALSGVFAHFSRDPETAAKLVKIASLLPMIKKQLQIEQTRVRICAIAAVGNLGSHGAADIDPGLPAPTAFLVGAYREYLAYHLLEEMQVWHPREQVIGTRYLPLSDIPAGTLPSGLFAAAIEPERMPRWQDS